RESGLGFRSSRHDTDQQNERGKTDSTAHDRSSGNWLDGWTCSLWGERRACQSKRRARPRCDVRGRVRLHQPAYFFSLSLPNSLAAQALTCSFLESSASTNASATLSGASSFKAVRAAALPPFLGSSPAVMLVSHTSSP